MMDTDYYPPGYIPPIRYPVMMGCPQCGNEWEVDFTVDLGLVIYYRGIDRNGEICQNCGTTGEAWLTKEGER